MTTTLARQRPDPIPSIHPVPEYLAKGDLKTNYEDMKAVMQVPWMGVVTMAYAHYPTFFGRTVGGHPRTHLERALRRGVAATS